MNKFYVISTKVSTYTLRLSKVNDIMIKNLILDNYLRLLLHILSSVCKYFGKTKGSKGKPRTSEMP